MIKVIVGTNTSRKSVMVDPSRTLKSVLEENGVDYSRGGIHLDGLAVGGEGINRTFAEHGITEDCILISVVKGDGGVM